MSWVSKTVKKAAKSVKKHLGKHWWVPGYNIVKGGAELYGGAYDEYKRNEGLYNRMALIIGGSVLSGGLLGAAAGATGLLGEGVTAATGAAAGATTGAVSGATTAGTAAYQERQTNKALEEQEKIQREAQEEQLRIARANALKDAAGTPTEQTAFNFLAYSGRGSQIKQTRVSRNKKVGGSSTTLG